MKSSLEKTVTKEVRHIKATKKAKEEKERKERAEFEAKLPKTREERAKLVWPSITDGDKWKIYFDAGHWRLQFVVGGMTFEMCNEWIPRDEGTPTEGYGPTEAHWSNHLFVQPPDGGYMLDLGYAGDLDNSWLASRNNKPTETWNPKKEMKKEVAKLNKEVARMVKEALLHKKDYRWFEK